MKKVLLSFLAIAILSGCSVQKEMYPVGGSKADGTITMAYEYTPMQSPKVDLEQAAQSASKKCQIWGYDAAEAFGGKLTRCSSPSALGGCERTEVSIQYQCVGGKASLN